MKNTQTPAQPSMKEVDVTSSTMYKYYPAGEMTRQGRPRQSSYLQMLPAMIGNHDPLDNIASYAAFNILADKMHALIQHGIKQFHVTYFKPREKRYGSNERVIQACNVIKAGEITSIELQDPQFDKPIEDTFKTIKDIEKLLSNFAAPSSGIQFTTMPHDKNTEEDFA